MSKPYQERLMALVRDTITLLCKNGLEYSQEFCVEGLLGVTLDKDEVFLIPIKELVADKGVGTSENQDEELQNVSQTDHDINASLSPKRERKKKRRHIESSTTIDDALDSPSFDWNNSTNDQLEVTDQDSLTEVEPPVSKRRHRDKNGDDSHPVKVEDVVVIKEEVDDVDFASAFHDNSLDSNQANIVDSNLAYFTQPGTSQQAGRLSYQMDQLVGGSSMTGAVSLSGVSGMPSGEQGDESWDMSQGNMSNSQADWQQGQKHQWECATCGRMFGRRSWLKRHTDSVHLRLRPASCDLCGKVYSSTGNLNAHKRLAHTSQLEKPIVKDTLDSSAPMYMYGDAQN